MQVTCQTPIDELKEKRAVMRRQFTQIIRTSTDGSGCPKVTCGCGSTLPVRFAFKCYFCCQWFCERCAGEHFGMTRDDWYRNKEKAPACK